MRLVHARDQEHLVVHGQAEQDADDEHGQQAQHRVALRGGEDRVEPAPLEHRDGDAHARAEREQEADRGDQRHEQGAEDDDQQQQGQADDDDQVGDQGGGQPFVGVDADRGLAGDQQVHPGHGVGAVTDVVHEPLGALVDRAGGGHDLEQRCVAGGVDAGGDDGGDPAEGGESGGHLVQAGLHAVALREHDQRSLIAGAERVGDLVVGGALGAVGVLASGGGQRGGQREHRYGQHEQARHGAHEHRDRPADDQLDPAVQETDPIGADRRATAVLTTWQGVASHQLERGGQQRERHQHGDRYPDRGGHAHLGDEADADHCQPGQGDDHRAAGEHDRGSGGAGGTSDRVRHRAPLAQLGPEAGQDEQAVVDAHGQAEHHRQGRGHAADGREGGERQHAERAHRDADQGTQHVGPGGGQ